MSDLISRQDAIELIHSLYPSAPIMRMNRARWKEKYKPYIEVEKLLEMLPSAQSETFEWCHDCKEYDQEKHCCHRWTKQIRKTVAELEADYPQAMKDELEYWKKRAEEAERKGKWIPNQEHGTFKIYTCSKCGWNSEAEFNFCSNCGADMKGENMADMMTFPNTVEEFMEQYKITDTEQIYTNGTELVPIFRMKQWFNHKPERKRGRWIPVDSYSAFGGDEEIWMAHGNPVAFHYCSECKNHAHADEFGKELLTSFCPECGADMRGD